MAIPRKKGTLRNFVGDGNLTPDGLRWCLHTGKVPVGQENKLLVTAEQLKAWGIYKEVKR